MIQSNEIAEVVVVADMCQLPTDAIAQYYLTREEMEHVCESKQPHLFISKSFAFVQVAGELSLEIGLVKHHSTKLGLVADSNVFDIVVFE